MIAYLCYLAVTLYVVMFVRYAVIDVREVAQSPSDVVIVMVMSALWLPIQLWIACTIGIAAMRRWNDS